ncbi:unannotated protein [freshwater metagenome]|uniref:Unannotated protein n=1 Tax=freshwater metagenome TaxID=449393 RepID=A0A6J7U789_9ZZZZ
MPIHFVDRYCAWLGRASLVAGVSPSVVSPAAFVPRAVRVRETPVRENWRATPAVAVDVFGLVPNVSSDCPPIVRLPQPSTLSHLMVA